MTDPLIALLYRLNQNQNALGAAIEELAIWIEQRGSVETANQAMHHHIASCAEPRKSQEGQKH